MNGRCCSQWAEVMGKPAVEWWPAKDEITVQGWVPMSGLVSGYWLGPTYSELSSTNQPPHPGECWLLSTYMWFVRYHLLDPDIISILIHLHPAPQGPAPPCTQPETNRDDFIFFLRQLSIYLQGNNKGWDWWWKGVPKPGGRQLPPPLQGTTSPLQVELRETLSFFRKHIM